MSLQERAERLPATSSPSDGPQLFSEGTMLQTHIIALSKQTASVHWQTSGSSTPPCVSVSMCSTSSLSSNYSLSSIIKDVFVWWLAGNPTCVSSFSSTFGSAWRIKVPRTRTFTCRWVVHCATWSPACNWVILCSFDLACSLHKVLKCYEWCNSGKVYKNPSLPQYLSSTRGLDWSYDDTPCSCLSFVLFVEGRW